MRAVVDAREAAGDLRGAIDARRQLAWVLYNAGELGPAADASYALVTDACRALGTADPLTRDAVREYVQFAGQCGQFDGRQLEQVVAALGGPESVNTVVLLSDLGAALVDNGNFAAAEGVLRRVVGLLAEHRPNGWGRPLADSRLGGALAGQGKFTEAEPLLVGGYEGLKTKESTIPPAGKSAPTEAAERLVWMYEAWGKANNANKAARRAELAARLNAEYPLVDPPAGGQAGSPAEAPTAITPRTAPATLPAKAIP
jgi:hypothetical protein